MLTLTASTERPNSLPCELNAFVVPLRYQSTNTNSDRVPVTVGIPVRHGELTNVRFFEVHDPATGWATPCQVAWSPDRSWLQATFLSPDSACAALLLRGNTDSTMAVPLQLDSRGDSISIDTRKLHLRVPRGGEQLVERVRAAGNELLKASGMQLIVAAQRGKRLPVRWREAFIEDDGPLRATLRLEGQAHGLRVSCRLSCYADTGLLRCEITLHNPRRAKHPAGYWDLGDPGSMLFREVALELDLALDPVSQIHWRERREEPSQQTTFGRLAIYQESSGGENWRSLNHVNRDGQVPLRFAGYRVRTTEPQSEGRRANPIVSLVDNQRSVTCAVEEFWEKFPTAIVVEQNKLCIKLLPAEFPDLHELQAGESSTRVVWLQLGRGDHDPIDRLAWVYDPPQVTVDPAYLAGSETLPYFPPADSKLRPEYEQILSEAVTGPRSFFAKRETIDEYSWRNFGDMWADHEEAYAEDQSPVVSHYNNQYDLLHGLLVQYLRTGDRRWWQLADPLARHVIDIDIYRTSRDKPAYNNGLFWHTAHYHAVGRATHRSMSSTMRGKRIAAPGTGPGNEHNYSSGLLLYHYLTGCLRARDTVVDLADWVLAMDDGEQHVLGLFSAAPTGIATCTTEPAYHGPGRGAANSIQALLNGWKITRSEKYLEYAITLIRRTVHPLDDIEVRQLNTAELRWSYTVYLQALDRLLLETEGRNDLRAIRAYAQQALLHYARWMAKHETFYLDKPDQLEYPTETWAAQELRKGTTLLMAARRSPPAEAMGLRDCAHRILDRAWQALMQFESRVCTRPLALVLQQGHLEASLQSALSAKAERTEGVDYGRPSEFLSQKDHLRMMRRSPQRIWQAFSRAVHPRRWMNAFRQLWIAERLRRCLGG